MKVLVTGGAGFIGSHLVEGLLQRGDSVRVLDDFTSGRRANLEPLTGDLTILEGDLRDGAIVRQAVAGCTQVYHLAAFVSVPRSMADPQSCFDVNVGGTVCLLEAARQAAVRRVVLSSSTAVYGNPITFPTSEEVALLPLSPYAVSKQVNELYARLYSQVFGLGVVALRYFNVYGPRQRPDTDYAAAIPLFIRHLLTDELIPIFGDGGQSRDFVFVKDVVQANLLAAEADACGEAFNICSGHETSLRDLMQVLSSITARQPELRHEAPRPGDIYRSLGDPEKAARRLGFRAGTSLADGLRQTVEWMTQHAQ